MNVVALSAEAWLEEVKQASSAEGVYHLAWMAGALETESSRAQDLWQRVALHAPVLDEVLVCCICQFAPSHAMDLLRNPACTPELVRVAVEHLIRELERAEEKGASHSAPAAARALAQLAGAGVVEAQWQVARRLSPLALEGEGEADVSLLQVLTHLRVEEALLLRLVERYRGQESALFQLAQAPAATAAVFRALLESSDAPTLFQLLAVRPEARTDPVVRKRLREYARSHSTFVQARLLLEAAPEEFRELLANLAGRSPEEAAWALEQSSPLQRALLGREDLLPLLQAEEAAVRLVAIRSLPERVTKSPASSSPRSPRSRG